MPTCCADHAWRVTPGGPSSRATWNSTRALLPTSIPICMVCCSHLMVCCSHLMVCCRRLLLWSGVGWTLCRQVVGLTAVLLVRGAGHSLTTYMSLLLDTTFVNSDALATQGRESAQLHMADRNSGSGSGHKRDDAHVIELSRAALAAVACNTDTMAESSALGTAVDTGSSSSSSSRSGDGSSDECSSNNINVVSRSPSISGAEASPRPHTGGGHSTSGASLSGFSSEGTQGGGTQAGSRGPGR